MSAVSLSTKGRISSAAETIATMGRIRKVRALVSAALNHIRVSVKRVRFRTTVKR